MSLRVEEYVRADGSIPYRTWFDALEAQAAAKVAVAKIRLSLGNTSRVKHRQQADVARAKALHAEYKARKAAARKQVAARAARLHGKKR